MHTDIMPIGARRFDWSAAATLAGWLQWTLGGIAGLALAGGALVLFGRRLAGAYETPLSTAALAALAATLAGLAWLASTALIHPAAGYPRTWRGQLLAASPWLLAAVAALAVSVPGSAAAGVGMLWGLLAITCYLRLHTGIRHTRRLPAQWPGVSHLRGVARRVSAREPKPGSQPGRLTTRQRTSTRLELPLAEAGETQFLIRWEEAGHELMRGRVRGVIPAGRRSASAHVAFCPPFLETPLVEIITSAPPGLAALTVGQALPHGVRFDAKLERSLPRALDVRFEFRATAVPVDTDRPTSSTGGTC